MKERFQMAYIVKQNSKERIVDQQEVASFLNEQEVIYENWNIEKLPANLQEKFLLSDEEKQQILDAFKAEIEDISNRRGYQAQDVISLSSNTPNLDQLLANFKQEHHHTDDEVRFIVSGHGVFVIQGKDGEFFEVFLNPGDLISVPENVRHYFTLQDDRQVVAVRIFVTSEGWVPIYENEKVSQ
jgi:1,2-dihydroxy-3-keto-5-methylthiopentene dioxygenase